MGGRPPRGPNLYRRVLPTIHCRNSVLVVQNVVCLREQGYSKYSFMLEQGGAYQHGDMTVCDRWHECKGGITK